MNTIKAVAGYSMLMILAAVDGKVDPAEKEEICQFVKKNFTADPVEEHTFLDDLNEDKFLQQFKREAEIFLQHSTPEERDRFMQYAGTVARADNSVGREENKYLSELKQYWKVSAAV